MNKHEINKSSGRNARRRACHWLSALLTLCMLLEPLPLSAMAEGITDAGNGEAAQDLSTAAVDTAAREVREEDLQQGYDAGAAPTMQPPAYGMSGNTLYFTLGEDMREALLSDVLAQLEEILRIELPFKADEVLAIAEYGSDDEDVDVLPGEEETDLVAVEQLEGDYRITALREFGEAGLVLYTETDSYTLKLQQGWVAEATPEPTIAPDDGGADGEGTTPSDTPEEEPAAEGRTPSDSPEEEPAAEGRTPSDSPEEEPAAEGRTPSDSPDGEPAPSGREPLGGDAVQPSAATGEATGDAVQPSAATREATGDVVQPSAATGEATGDAVQKPSLLGEGGAAQSGVTEEVPPVAAQSADDTTGDTIPDTDDDEGPHPTEPPIGEGIGAAQSADDTTGDIISGTEDDEGPHPTEPPIGEGTGAAQSADDTKEEDTPDTTTEPSEITPDTPDTTTETTDTPESPITYPAQSFTARTSRVRVSVEAGEGAFPEGTRMKVVPVWARDTLNGIRESVSGDDDAVNVMSVAAVDITFYDKDGNEIEPLIPISVVMSVDEIDETQQALVVHVDDAGNAAVVADAEASGDGEKLSLNVEMAGTEGAEGRTPSDSPDGEPAPSERTPSDSPDGEPAPSEREPLESADDTKGDIIPGTEADTTTGTGDDEGPHPTSQSPDTFPTGEGSEADETTGDIIPGTEDDEGPHPTSQSPDTFPIGEGSETPGDIIPGTEADEGPHSTSQSPDTLPTGEGAGASGITGSAEAVAPESTTVTFAAESFSVYAVVIIETRYIAANGETYEIKVSYDARAGIPAGAALEVSEITGAEGEAYAAAAAEALDGAGIAYAKALDIKIVKDGGEIQPQAPVNVSIRLLDAPQDASDENLNVLHFGNEVEPVDCALNAGAVEFRAEGFSVYVVAYTVDFHYGTGEFDFSIVGGNTISMKELAARLHLVEVSDPAALEAALAELHPEPVKETIPVDDGDETDAVPNEAASAAPVLWPQEIEDFVTNIASVEWTNDDVARVVMVTEPTTVGDLVDSLGLENRFSAEMTDSQIEAAMNVALAEGDWAFISTQPFFTEEKLTITLQNGDVYEIGVTDAAGYVNTTLRNPTVNIKTGSTTTPHASNLNFTLTNNGLARVTGKADNTVGTYYYIPDKINYNGKDYQVYDIDALSPAAINGRHVIFDDDLCLHMLDANEPELVDIVDHILAKMMVDSGMAVSADFDGQEGRPASYVENQELTDQQVDALATKNDFAIGAKNEVDGNLFELFKRAKYDAENNKVTIELKYFQKMKKNVPLDFIFVYDDSGTMSSHAFNHTEQKDANNANIRYSATQSVWCRIALQVILKGIMDQQGRGYDIRMAPIAFATNAFWDESLTFYGTYADAKTAIGTYYTSGGTEHYKALDAAKLYANKSVNDRRNPVVVYLSDFHSNANSARAKQSAAALRAVKNGDEYVQIYTIHMFEPDFRYDRNIATDTHHMYILNDTRPISDLLTIFDTITKDAIGYYVGKNLSVQDALSDGLASMAQNVKISVPSANGSSAKDGSNTTWTFINGENRLQAGKIYSETIEVQLDDNVVFSPEMAANASAKVVKTTEDDNGGLHPNTVNEIENQPLPKKNLVMVLGRLDKSGTQTEDTIPGAKFKLTGGSNTEIELTTDSQGKLTVPTTFHFAQGSYTLTQLTTDDLEDDTPAMDMPSPASWTLTVDANGLMTAGGSGKPAMTVQKGQFHVWNKQHVEIMPTLIPVTVKKTWKNGPVGGETVPFAIYGGYSGERYMLAAYDGAKQSTANAVTELTAANVTVGTDASGNTTWTKRVFVPDRAGSAVFYTENASGNNQTYSYVVAEGDVPTVSGGYYTKGNEAVNPNSETIYETIYKTSGGWETYTGGTTQAQIHINLNDSKYNGTQIEGSDVLSNNAYNLVYKNTSKVYVEYTYYPTNNRNDDVQAIVAFDTTDDGNDHSRPGAQFMYVNLPSAWATVAQSSGHNYANTFEITKLIFIKSDGSSLIVYDKANNKSTNDNYLAKAPKTTFDKNGKYQGEYGSFLLVFDKKGDHTGSHTHISASSTGQTNKRLLPETTTEITNKSFSNSLILTMENTFVPLRTLDITSAWKDSSTDSSSTTQIQSVTYEILRKDGENWVPAVGTDGEALSTDALTAAVAAKSGEANTYEAKLNLTLPEGEYKVRQASYTLPNGRVVSADDSGAFAPYRLTSPNDPNPTVDNTTRTNTYVWENTRKYFDATVRTVWSPELAADDDPTGGSGLPYKLSYRSYNGGTVEEHNEDGTSLKSEGWTHEHSHIPAYGVDGVETQIVLNASDALAIAYNTEITRTEDSETHQTFTITNTERRVTFSVSKDWLDAEGQYIPEADRQPVTIEIWGIEKKAGGTVLFNNGLPQDTSFEWPTWDGTGDQNTQVTIEPTKGFFKFGENYYAIRQSVDVPNVKLKEGPEGERVQNASVKFNGTIITITKDEQVSGQLMGISRGTVLHDTRNGADDYWLFCRNDSGITNETFPHQDWYKLDLIGGTSSGSGNTQAEYPHTTQQGVDTLITSEHASQFDAGTKRVKADGVTAEYTITANDGWTKSFELPARYVYFAKEVKVGTLPLENEDNTENLENLAMFSPYYDYDQGAVTVAISNRFPIARVSNDGGANWHYFDTLLTVHAENYPEHQGAFNYANTLSGNVEIETLLENHTRYTLTSSFTFTGPTGITLRTTQDTRWNPSGNGHFTSTIKRGFGDGSLLAYTKQGGSVTVENIILDGDKAKYSGNSDGGLLFVDKATLHVTTGAVLRNSRTTSRGGAIGVNGGTLTVDGDAKILNCEAWHGGGIHTGDARTTATIGGTAQIGHCTATGYGGGIFFHNAAATVKDSATISNCTAAQHGGGINSGWGGTLTVSGSVTIEQCSAQYGGGINIEGNSGGVTATISGGVIQDCAASVQGGGVNVEGNTDGATLNLVGGKIGGDNTNHGNRAPNGGGVSVEAKGKLKITGGAIQNNTVTSATTGTTTGNGGGVDAGAGAVVTMSGGKISGNTVVSRNDQQGRGGGVCLRGASMTLSGTGEISGNSLSGKRREGGGVYIGEASGNSSLTMSGGKISGNSANIGGGVETGYNGAFNMSAGEISGNTASGGGGIYQWSTGAVTISGGKITDNTASQGSAILVHGEGARTVNLSGGEISGNHATNGDVGGAINVNEGSATLKFSGAIKVKDNTTTWTENGNSRTEKRNVVLKHDTNSIIQVPGALEAGASIGIYVSDTEYTKQTTGMNGNTIDEQVPNYSLHGEAGTPFGTWAASANLGVFVNDRNGLLGLKKNDSDKWIYWKDAPAYLRIINRSSKNVTFRVYIDDGKYHDGIKRRGNKQQSPDMPSKDSQNKYYYDYQRDSNSSEMLYLPGAAGKNARVEVWYNNARIADLAAQDIALDDTVYPLAAKYNTNGELAGGPDYNITGTYDKEAASTCYNQASANGQYKMVYLLDFVTVTKTWENVTATGDDKSNGNTEIVLHALDRNDAAMNVTMAQKDSQVLISGADITLKKPDNATNSNGQTIWTWKLALPLGVNTITESFITDCYGEISTQSTTDAIVLAPETSAYISYMKTIDVTNHRAICKIVEEKTVNGSKVKVEHPFDSLNAALGYARDAANGLGMSENKPVKIEMLVDYVVPAKDRVALGSGDNIILTTAPTSASFSGEMYLFSATGNPAAYRTTADSPDTAILQRGWDGGVTNAQALFYLDSSARLTTTKITFDGTSKLGTETDATQKPGRAVCVNSGSLTADGNTTFRSFSVSGNNGNGGAVYATGALTYTVAGGGNVLFDNCAATNGGAVYAVGALTVSGAGHTTFTRCTAQNGGGIYQNGDGNMTLTNVTFGKSGDASKGCFAEGNGGSVYSNGDNTTMTDCDFHYSKAGSGTNKNSTHGGAVCNEGNGEHRILGCVFEHCSANTTTNTEGYGNGGAVYVGVGATMLTIDKSDARRSSFKHCSAYRYGGAVILEQNGGCTLSVSHADFENCHTQIRDGGAVYSDSDNTTFEDCAFKGCYAESTGTNNGGGAIYMNGDRASISSTVTISNCRFEDCHAFKNGGAIHFYSTGTNATLTNVQIDGHTTGNATSLAAGTANAQFGGAIYSNGNVTIAQSGTGMCAITNCSTQASNADVGGGAVNMKSGSVSFGGNVVIFDNQSVKGGQTMQANVVLDKNNNTTIKTASEGLGANAHIGVYVTGKNGTETEPYLSHGGFEDDFGTIGGDGHLDRFTNDRNGMYGVKCDLKGGNHGTNGHQNIIRWQAYVLKLTDESDNLLFYRDDNGEYHPALYNTLKDGFEAAAGTLYSLSGDTYAAIDANEAVQACMLRNYTKPAADTVTNTAARDVTFTTAGTSTAAPNTVTTGSQTYVLNFNPGGATDKDTATVTRGASGPSSMLTHSSDKALTLTNLALDGGYVATATSPITCAGDGGIVNVTKGTLNIGTDAALKNSQADKGGAVYVAGGATVTMTGGTITGNSATNGGAVYVDSGARMTLEDLRVTSGATTTTTSGTITGNTATTAGAGIYLVDGATLNLSGSPNFGGKGTDSSGALTDGTIDVTVGSETVSVAAGNFVTKDSSFKRGSEEPKNGQQNYLKDGENYKVRQDIYIAGYLGTTDYVPATSLYVTGEIPNTLTNDVGERDGSIWVWAETPASENENNHYQQLKQFAVFATGLAEAQRSSTARVFRNAADDESTQNGTDSYLTGSLEGDLTVPDGAAYAGYIYWTGVSGSRRVLLRKVNGSYAPVTGARFNLYKGGAASPYVVRHKEPSVNDETMNDKYLVSQPSGVIWTGNLPYGLYILEETDPSSKWFYFIVDEDGEVMSEGYSSREDALNGGDALYKQRRAARTGA